MKTKYRMHGYRSKNLVYIEDMNVGMSVTNNAENVINEIVSKFDWIDSDTKFYYMDSEGIIDEIIPAVWKNGYVQTVIFRPGNFKSYLDFAKKHLNSY